MRTRYIANNLAPDGYPSAPVLRDPIFTPLFAGTVLGNITIAGISAATIASAIATTFLTYGVNYK